MSKPFFVSDELPHWRVHSDGYLVDLSAAGADDTHQFCGPNRTPGATCFVGQHPLLKLLDLDATDPRLGLQGLGIQRLPLLYCWRCDVSELSYTVNQEGTVSVHGETEWREALAEMGISVEDVRARIQHGDFPYPGYPESFPPAAVELVPLAQDEQREFIERASKQEPDSTDPRRLRHQVGGYPYLVQDNEWAPECDGCSAPMTFLAVISDGNQTPKGFTDNPYVQVVFFLCPACRRVHASNICD